MQHCSGRTKAGTPCRAPAGSEGLCFFHANPEKAHTLGQIGGRKNRGQLPEPPAAGSLSAGDLRDVLAQAIRDVQSKKITPRTAGAVSQLCNSLYRVLQTADLEARLASVEQQLAEQESRIPTDTDSANLPKRDETGSRTDEQLDDVESPGNGYGEGGGNDGSRGGGK